MQKLFLLICLHFVACLNFAQDGTILKEEIYTLSDSIVEGRVKYYPNLRENLNQVVCKRIVYESDGIPIRGYLIEPKAKGSYPCIIYNRGGHGKYGSMTDAFTAKLIEYSSMGFIVIATQFRGGCEDCEGNDEVGGKDINDVMNLFPILDQMPNADTSTLVMIGASRGGINTCQALTKTDRIDLAILLYSPTNLFYNVDRVPEMENVVLPHFIENYWDHRDSLLTERSPVFWADQFSKKTNVVFLHGTADERAFYEEAVELYDLLKKQRINTILETFEGGNHNLITHWEESWIVLRHYLYLVKDNQAIVPSNR
jgi:dipeptidyl aminopeptidase/acylaminoacyl peptidase